MNEKEISPFNFEKKRIWLALLPALVIVSFVWLVFLLNYSGLLGDRFSQWGIRPGDINGLKNSMAIGESLAKAVINSLKTASYVNSP